MFAGGEHRRRAGGWGRFCHRKVDSYRNGFRCKWETSKEAGNWEVVSLGGSILICCVKEIPGEQKGQKTSTKRKKKNIYIVRYPEKEKSKQNLCSNYAALGPERVDGLLFQHAKNYSAGSKEISNTKDKC